MKVTVLYGGPSSEREISLVSGSAVAEGLRSVGHDVLLVDIRPDDLSALDKPADVIFPVLHGAWGESGELQEILEQRNLPFVGSGSKASRLGMDKVASKREWERVGLPTSPYLVLTRATRNQGWQQLGLPVVVKALLSGSSIGVYICKAAAEAQEKIDEILATDEQVLVEKYIKGIELTVGIIEEQPLAPIRIATSRAFFDTTAKYQPNQATHHFDLGVPGAVAEQVREIARRAHATLGCRDLSRVDFMLDEQHRPYLLEINTLPGFTPVSLLPEAARHAGIEFGPLVDRLVRRAYERHHRGQPGA